MVRKDAYNKDLPNPKAIEELKERYECMEWADKRRRVRAVFNERIHVIKN